MAHDQPRNVRLESDEAHHDIGPEEVAQSDRIMTAMADDIEENDESDEDGNASASAPAASVKTPAVRGSPRRSSRFVGTDDGAHVHAHVRQTRGDYGARSPDKKKARCTQGA